MSELPPHRDGGDGLLPGNPHEISSTAGWIENSISTTGWDRSPFIHIYHDASVNMQIFLTQSVILLKAGHRYMHTVFCRWEERGWGGGRGGGGLGLSKRERFTSLA